MLAQKKRAPKRPSRWSEYRVVWYALISGGLRGSCRGLGRTQVTSH
jgi:hypothetical protein